MFLQAPVQEFPAPLFAPAHHRRALDARYEAITGRGARPLIVDCGANIGASAVWFRRRYPQARIVAIEPAAGNLALLRRNAEGLGIQVLEAAIGPEDGTGFLDGRTRSPLSHRVHADGAGTPVPLVSLRTVLDAAEGAEPFILKIDIEGSEKTLFGTGTDRLASFPLIVIEPHDFCMPGDEVSRAFFAFHARHGRDFLFSNENVFSVDYRALMASAEPDGAARSTAACTAPTRPRT